jgi:hypothetical protein
MGQIKGIIFKGQIFDPKVKNSLNGPVEQAIDSLTGQVNLPSFELSKLKTGFGINKEAIKIKARATVDMPDDRAKIKFDLIIDGVAEVNKKGFVKEFFADGAAGSTAISVKKSGFKQSFNILIETLSPINVVKDGLGGNLAAVLGKIDIANSDFGPLF